MGRLENNCIILLNHIADNPDAPQDLYSLSEATGIAKLTLFYIIYYPWRARRPERYYYWALEKYAEKYKFNFKVLHGDGGKHLWVARKQ